MKTYKLIINDGKYLFAHAMASDPDMVRDDYYYMMGKAMTAFMLQG